MRFFTPELYLQFNSPDDETADRANEAWEAALSSYRSHLENIKDRMPSQLRRLAEQSHHDAEVLSISEDIDPFFPMRFEPFFPGPLWMALGVVTLKEENGAITNLIYTLWDRIRSAPAPAGWPFSKKHKHWLYDEIDLFSDQRGMFIHRILFSDGSTIEIPLLSVVVHQFSLDRADVAAKRRKTA